MLLQRSAVAAARRVAPRAVARRTFASSIVRRDAPKQGQTAGEGRSLLEGYKNLDQIKTTEDLLPPGAKPGTVPTDIEQATGLERLEILGKMQGIDIFDMRPLDSSRVGTLEDPIVVNSAGPDQYVGCTGCPADSHEVKWITLSRDEPLARCMECGSAYKMHYIGPEEDPHAHGHSTAERPKNMSDFIKPEYLYH
ncbi:COX5B-domain-containing protein [Sporormia fimetaria CBS 119925]|uniref:Cytochrome c oxidase subunit 4, mitochondrial n=1 Tax=Sporormia fimetaria CBS 119925 TaxID=1340428 RepID=A0A6A6VD26_9PLEO|nr:COX5B-domain-containing protein [Sporormia fimetaria CBS 119925]